MRKFGWLLGLLVLSATPAYSQATSVEVNQPVRVAFDHTGQHTSGFRIYQDATRVAEIPLSELQAGSVTTTVPAFTTRGPHVIGVSAYNADAESARATLDVTAVLPTPTVPTNLRIVIQLALNPDGSIGVTWAPAQ